MDLKGYSSFAVYCGLWMLWFAFMPSAGAAPSSFGIFSEPGPVPAGAKVTLYADQREFFLGENVLIHFCLDNVGDEPFEISTGGDYRGSSRHLRFKVSATDDAGADVEDPDPFPNCWGGLGGATALESRESFTQSLPLMRYCQIEKPGLYTIRATHDFGWEEGDRKKPIGEIQIRFRMPNEAKARQVVDTMLKLPVDPGHIYGDRAIPYSDFSCLMHPVYLEILEELARDGNKRAFEGLQRIPTVAATQILIRLAESSNAKIALQAAQALNVRLPYPSQHDVPGSSGDSQLSIRGRLVERAWTESLVPVVRALAGKLLASNDPSSVKASAFMIESVGTTDDASAVLHAINRVQNDTFSVRDNVDDNILNYPKPLNALLRAMDALHAQGYSLNFALSGDAEFLLYFYFLQGDSAPRSKQWTVMLDAYGAGSWYPVREAAVRSIPSPIPEACMDFIMERFEDGDLGVCRAACSVAGASGDSAFVPPLIEIISTEKHEWLWREAANSARELGAGFELFEAAAERLNDDKLCYLALDYLQLVLEVPQGGWSGRNDLSRSERLQLRNVWRAFLIQHEVEIRAGKKFALSDPAVTPALVGRARFWSLEDGTTWP